MTIPYLATVSCAMLASNSSSVLQGIVYDGGAQAPSPQPIRGFWTEIKSRLRQNTVSRHILQRLDGYQLIEHTYEGRFQTVTMWNRGPNKRRWVVSSPPVPSFPHQTSNLGSLLFMKWLSSLSPSHCYPDMPHVRAARNCLRALVSRRAKLTPEVTSTERSGNTAECMASTMTDPWPRESF